MDTKDATKIGDENRSADFWPWPRQRPGGVVAHGDGEFSQKDPAINVVYTINEPSAAGAYEAIKAAGKADGHILIVSVDGGCPGVKNVAAGVIGATSMQFPLLMASKGVEAVVESPIAARSPSRRRARSSSIPASSSSPTSRRRVSNRPIPPRASSSAGVDGQVTKLKRESGRSTALPILPNRLASVWCGWAPRSLDRGIDGLSRHRLSLSRANLGAAVCLKISMRSWFSDVHDG